MQYLSDEWMAAAGQALAGSEPLAALAAPRIALQYEVTGAPDGKRSYTVLLGDGPAALEPGVHAEPDASFTIDYPTAAEIARGELAAQVAFMQGRLKLGGDIDVLIRRATELKSLDDALAAVRADTEF
jgi:putative sterol carrier protein